MKWINILLIVIFNAVICASFSLDNTAKAALSHLSNDSRQLSEEEVISIADDGPLIIPLKHWRQFPFARPPTRNDSDNDTDEECDSSSDEFPAFLSEYQLNHGGVILCFIIGFYHFTLLAVVCDRYFLPCVETICEVLHLSPDVAAATFMSVATSCPEFFTNIISTFITESDLGIGTIVGSSLFNALGVASIGGLCASTPLKLDWWPVTRDVCIYIMAVALLIVITWDGYIYWYEGLTLFIVYFVYFAVMFQNTRISKFVKGHLQKNKVVDIEPAKEGKEEARVSVVSAYGSYLEEVREPGYAKEHEKQIIALEEEEKKEAQKSLFRWPEGKWYNKLFFFYSWPIQFCLRYTVPNPKLHPKLFPITFIMCIIWIGTNAYMVSWMMTLIGSVLYLPDAVLGLSFLAAGSALPESISMAIISRRGEGAFGVSNSLGANTMNILLSLGMPWFFKTIAHGANDSSFIKIQSGSIEYTIMALIVVAICLYTVLFLNKFRLGRRVGLILLSVYIVFVVLAILSELVFFDNSVCIG